MAIDRKTGQEILDEYMRMAGAPAPAAMPEQEVIEQPPVSEQPAPPQPQPSTVQEYVNQFQALQDARRDQLRNIALFEAADKVGRSIASGYGGNVEKADTSTLKEIAEGPLNDYLEMKKSGDAQAREARLQEALGLRKEELNLKKSGEERRVEQFDFKKDETEKERKEKILGKWNSDKTAQAARDGIRAAEKAEEILKSGGKMTPAIMGRLLARMAGEVGVMTDKDVADFRGSVSWKDSFERWFIKGTTSELTEQDKKAMQKMIKNMKQAERDAYAGHAYQTALQYQEASGLDHKSIYKMLMPRSAEQMFDRLDKPNNKNTDEYVRMRLPSGTIKLIPKDQVEKAKKMKAVEID